MRNMSKFVFGFVGDATQVQLINSKLRARHETHNIHFFQHTMPNTKLITREILCRRAF